ncbi:glycerate 2-kinase [Corchorus olitorius]|uniref:Glycerate 2-kinase n=1 Tax=Corchorus olitorius TaxID=93759 RepID=A0A1R3JU61_9ROSI|nr:glycerate 2-kinase [Corchorus olitorius]
MAKMEENVAKVVEEAVLSSEKRLEGEIADVRRTIHQKSLYQRLLELGAIFSTGVSTCTLKKDMDMVKKRYGGGGVVEEKTQLGPTRTILDISKIGKPAQDPFFMIKIKLVLYL